MELAVPIVKHLFADQEDVEAEGISRSHAQLKWIPGKGGHMQYKRGSFNILCVQLWLYIKIL